MRKPTVLIKTRYPIEEQEQDFCIPNPQKIRVRDVSFEFDRILAHNENLFDSIGQDLLDYFRQGNNACVLAYGPSGTGKSHTMLGATDESRHEGLLRSVLKDLFNSKTSDSLIKLGCLEVYRESLYDLSKSKKVPLKLRVGANNIPFVPDLDVTIISDYQEGSSLIDSLIELRRTRATKINDQSSRSHVIFVLELHSRQSLDAHRLCIVDLAGSERASASQASGELFEDAKHINLSLTVLGNIISNLTMEKKPMAAMNPFLRYRDHKLTHFLQSCLMSYTVFVCCINPRNLAETQHTLQFAANAANIKQQAEPKSSSTPGDVCGSLERRIEVLEKLLQAKDEEISLMHDSLKNQKNDEDLSVEPPSQQGDDSHVESEDGDSPLLQKLQYRATTPRVICQRRSTEAPPVDGDEEASRTMHLTHFLCEYSGGVSATPNYNLASSSEDEYEEISNIPIGRDLPVHHSASWSGTADESTGIPAERSRQLISSPQAAAAAAAAVCVTPPILDEDENQCYQSILKNIAKLTECLGVDALMKAEQAADIQLKLLGLP